MSESAARPHKRILDMGCGTGCVLAAAPSAASRRLRVGADLSLTRLLEGRWRFHGLLFVAADGTALPFCDASFDEVIGDVSLPYMNTRGAIAEMYRVLVPGAVFAVTVHSLRYVRHRLLQSLRTGRQRDVLFMVYVIVNRILNHCGLPQIPWFRGRFETFNTAAGVRRIVQKAGFSRIRFDRWPTLIFFGVTGRKPDGQADTRYPDPTWFFSIVVPTDAGPWKPMACTEPSKD